MDLTATSKSVNADAATLDLVSFLTENDSDLGLDNDNAELYYDFPVLKDLEDVVVISKLLLLSRNHGFVAFATTNITYHDSVYDRLQELDVQLEHVFSLLYSRLLRNKSLRRNKTQLSFPTNSIIYAPLIDNSVPNIALESLLARNRKNVGDMLAEIRCATIDDELFNELVSTIEGSKGLRRLKPRPQNENPTSKGNLANGIETEISSFDQRQKYGAMVVVEGFQRIRGLAGSGKTVVLAMKAALTHLRNPEATILYTFHTRSLYQHIQNLVTRFYRQFDDKDPDWTRLKIMHAWGGRATPGVYFNACVAFASPPMPFNEAIKYSRQPFDYVCKKLLTSANIYPTYDYIFIDEGQDFPAAFVELCVKLSTETKTVLAYDDLQTIFQVATPTLGDIVGVDTDGKPVVELTEDVVLYKCYRNPREILVCAHALGFGIYGKRIVQMLENQAQWEDVGYKVVRGSFTEGDSTIIERPAENSLGFLSSHQSANEIVQTTVFDNYEEEAAAVVESIKLDLSDGLRADDILIVVADDRNAKLYFHELERQMQDIRGLQINNIHSDPYGIKDFQTEGAITLSTIHKAKGNEAFMVYVMGVDALFTSSQTVRDRNLVFTAMTRAKGWVRVSGVGSGAVVCKGEVDKALEQYPNLVFKYPSAEELKILRRDLTDSAIQKQARERKLREILDQMSFEEVELFINQQETKKKKTNKGR